MANLNTTTETTKFPKVLEAFICSYCFELPRFYVRQANYSPINITHFTHCTEPQKLEVSDETVAVFIVTPKKDGRVS